MVNIRHMVGLAEYAAKEAGRAIMDINSTGSFNVRLKDDASPVSDADKASQRIIGGHLAMTGLPVLSEETIHLSYKQRKNWEYFWLVDPLDGTKEFIGGDGDFTVNIALVHRSGPIAGIIYAPAIDKMYTSDGVSGVFKKEKGRTQKISPIFPRVCMQDLQHKEKLTAIISRSHCSDGTAGFLKQFHDVRTISMGSSLKFMALIEQQADLYPRLGTTMEWDTAAAHAILNAANKGVYELGMLDELQYNKADLRNPFFVAL
jgi:3'(2'), 5'-bisphosphate nucleotidase